MRSYAAIDNSGKRVAVCEVDQVETVVSNPENPEARGSVFIEIDIDMIKNAVGNFEDSDVLVVEHDGETVSKVYSTDEMTEVEKGERQRRLDFVRKLMNS